MFNRCNQPRPNMCCEPRANMCCEPRGNMFVEQKMNCGPNYQYEPAVTNCVEKEFFHEVQHIIPVHTHVVNKHIYNHTYTPQYSCSEESQVINNECCGMNYNNFLNR